VGTDGNDMLLGGAGSDTIYGGPGNDVIWGDRHPVPDNGPNQTDNLYGGAGNDWIYTSHGTNHVYAGPGDDHVFAYFGNGTIDCGPGNGRPDALEELRAQLHVRQLRDRDHRLPVDAGAPASPSARAGLRRLGLQGAGAHRRCRRQAPHPSPLIWRGGGRGVLRYP